MGKKTRIHPQIIRRKQRQRNQFLMFVHTYKMKLKVRKSNRIDELPGPNWEGLGRSGARRTP